MTTYKVKPGETVVVEITDDRPKVSGKGQGGSGFIGAESTDDQLYVFRRGGALAFYDLGTRLRSVAPTTFDGMRIREYLSQELTAPLPGYYNEYVEIRFEVQGTFVAGRTVSGNNPTVFASRMTLSAAEHLKLNRALLGSLAPHVEGQLDDPVDPTAFSPANGSNRSIANCQQSFFAYFTPYATEVNGETVHTEDSTTRPAAAEDDSERWNPLNERGAGIVIRGQRTFTKGFVNRLRGHGLSFSSPGSGRHETFDTDDLVNFKVTAAPLFSSDEVAFSLSGDEGVYLRPALQANILQVDAPIIGTWAGPASPDETVYPLFDFSLPYFGQCPGLTGATSGDNLQCGLLRSLYSNLAGSGPGHANWEYTFTSFYNRLPAGSLVAIIKRGETRFYVWRKTDLADLIVPYDSGNAVPG